MDVGEVNGRRFINNAIIGLYPIYRFQRERNEKRGKHKFLAMASAVISVFRLNPGLRVSLEAEGKSVERKTPFLMVANNRHEMEGYRWESRKPQLGSLCVYVMHHMSRFRLGLLGLSLLLGRFSKSRDFDVLSAPEVKLERQAQDDWDFARWGSNSNGTPVALPVTPGLTAVIVPESYKARN